MKCFWKNNETTGLAAQADVGVTQPATSQIEDLAAQADVGVTQLATSQMEEDHYHHSPVIALKMNVRNRSTSYSSATLHEGMEQHLLT